MPDELLKLLLTSFGGFVLAAVLIAACIFFFPQNVERIVGWFATGIAHVFGRFDRGAVRLRVQGEINTLRSRLFEGAPDGFLERRLKIKWKTAEEAEALVRGGDVIVFMKNAKHHEENVATAIMAYLPVALVPRARPYVEKDTMRAIDLTIAKALLSHDDASEGALSVFYDRHLDPARADSDSVRQRLAEIDRIDVHGWLQRILLEEYRRLGEMLHPSEPHDVCLAEADRFATWLYDLAKREPGSTDGSLTFPGRYLRVAIVFVAVRGVLEEKGVGPYRARAKRHIYSGKYDSVYLIARDRNIGAVDELVGSIEGDAMIASVTRQVFPLRRDFYAHVRLRRDRGICTCLRRRQGGSADEEDAGADQDLPYESSELAGAPEAVGGADVTETAEPAAEPVGRAAPS